MYIFAHFLVKGPPMYNVSKHSVYAYDYVDMMIDVLFYITFFLIVWNQLTVWQHVTGRMSYWAHHHGYHITITEEDDREERILGY